MLIFYRILTVVISTLNIIVGSDEIQRNVHRVPLDRMYGGFLTVGHFTTKRLVVGVVDIASVVGVEDHKAIQLAFE